MMGFNQEILSIEWNRSVRDYVHSFLHEIPGNHGLQPQLSLAQTLPLEFLGARASHFLSECRISRCTSWRVVTDLPWSNGSNKHTVPCFMLFPMIAAYLWEMQVHRNTIHSDCLGYSKRKLPYFRNCEPIFFEMLNVPASYVGFRRVFVPQNRKASFGHIAGHKFRVAHVSSPSHLLFDVLNFTLPKTNSKRFENRPSPKRKVCS